MKKTVRALVACAAIAIAIPFSAGPASAKCYDNPPPPPPAADFIKLEDTGDLVAVCQGYDNCEATIAICLP